MTSFYFFKNKKNIYQFLKFLIIIHEIIIHRRLPPPSKTKSKYIKAIRKAHKIHHKNRNKDHCVNFGMLIVPFKYFK